MKFLVRRAVVWTVVFALVASAAAWRQCTSMELISAATAASSEHQHASGGHDHHAMDRQHAAQEPAAPAHADHGCMKCCSMCTVATALLPALPAATVFAASPAVFYSGYEDWSASTVAVDPGIPIGIV